MYLDEHGDVDVLVYAAWSGIAACYESQGEFDRAALKFTEYAEQNKGQMQTALALMNAARCYHLAGQVETAKKELERVTREHADSPVAGRARDQLNML
jgi:TolA-binding protein